MSLTPLNTSDPVTGYRDRINELLGETAREVGTPGNPAYQNSWTGNIRFWKQGSRVYMAGTATRVGGSTAAIFTWPAGYEPPGTQRFAVPFADSGGVPGVGRVTLSVAPNVVLPEVSSVLVCFDGVSFDTLR